MSFKDILVRIVFAALTIGGILLFMKQFDVVDWIIIDLIFFGVLSTLMFFAFRFDFKNVGYGMLYGLMGTVIGTIIYLIKTLIDKF